MLPSISSIVRVRSGDSLDFSMLLGSSLYFFKFIYLMIMFEVSLLRGAGYDAYVVSGTAPAWVCNQDQSEVLKFFQVFGH
jgi:hypothetical protein